MAKRFTDIEIERDLNRIIFKHDKWIYCTGWDACSKRLQDRPAVYAIYLDGLLSYVGQSNTPRFRFTQHQFMDIPNEGFRTPWGVFSEMAVKIKYPSKYGMEAMIEKRLIKRLKPRFNAYHYKVRSCVSM